MVKKTHTKVVRKYGKKPVLIYDEARKKEITDIKIKEFLKKEKAKKKKKNILGKVKKKTSGFLDYLESTELARRQGIIPKKKTKKKKKKNNWNQFW